MEIQVENNVIDFEAKRLELYEKKRTSEAEQVESEIENRLDFLRGELFVVEGLISAIEFQNKTGQFNYKSLIESLYFARNDLSKAVEANEGPKPIS